MLATQISNMTEEHSDLELRRSQFKPQMSSLDTKQQQAVCVRRAYKKYGTKSNPVMVLDGLNMTVPKGTIYGLLGASGCGKTTLLNCIVGRKVLNSGEIWVLGGTPGSRGSGVPGPRVGYMPQETALYEEFSIRETFKYFGWISGLTTEKIEERLQFLSSLFILPDVDQLVKTLSGGEQRRVSLAATLLHEPELLILDEPTVGLDPVLRNNIWDYFTEITKQQKTTVIITTHYIEETRQAHLIGLMRGGYFLAEESPENLLTKFECESLEHVFLKLSVIQNMGKVKRDSIALKATEDIEVPAGFTNEGADLDDTVEEIAGDFGDNVSVTSRPKVSMAPEPTEDIPPNLPSDQVAPKKFSDYFQVVKADHLYALLWKNFLWMWRNIPVMVFLIGLPIVQTILFCLSLGHDPIGLPISVVNFELEEAELCKITPECNSTRLSCNYLANLQKRTLELNFYTTEEEAKESVRRGDTWATLVFASNFSEAISHRIHGGLNLQEWEIVSSSVEVYQDKSNENIATLLQRQLYFGLEDFIRDHLAACDIDGKVGTVPIRYQKPVYGDNNPDFTNFMAPGVMVTIVFYLALASTAGTILVERKQGMLERCLVSGITAIELLLSLIMTQFIVMSAQSSMVILFTYLFNITFHGALIWIILLALSTGLCGMCFGFVIGSYCDSFNSATYIGLGSLLPILLLCGIIWPVEGMAEGLKPISYILPLTKSTESLRSIMIRGWGITMPTVYAGFISTFIWIVIFLLITTFLLRFKRG